MSWFRPKPKYEDEKKDVAAKIKHITAPQAKLAVEKRLKEIHHAAIDQIMVQIGYAIDSGHKYCMFHDYQVTEQIEKHFEGLGYTWEAESIQSSQLRQSWSSSIYGGTADYPGQMATPYPVSNYRKLKFE